MDIYTHWKKNIFVAKKPINKTESVFLSIVQVLLMVQKSGYNQLRVVFPTIDYGTWFIILQWFLYIPGGFSRRISEPKINSYVDIGFKEQSFCPQKKSKKCFRHRQPRGRWNWDDLELWSSQKGWLIVIIHQFLEVISFQKNYSQVTSPFWGGMSFSLVTLLTNMPNISARYTYYI